MKFLYFIGVAIIVIMVMTILYDIIFRTIIDSRLETKKKFKYLIEHNFVKVCDISLGADNSNYWINYETGQRIQDILVAHSSYEQLKHKIDELKNYK